MYNIKAVSKIVGIPAITIRAWEKRYNAVQPKRTAGQHRLYSEEDIAKLKWLVDQKNNKGLSISQAVKLLNQKKESLLTANTSSMQSEGTNMINSDQNIIHDLYKKLLTFNSDDANMLIERAFSMFHYQHVFHKIITPICHQVGADWESNKISIAQEHFITHFFIQRFYQMFRSLPVNNRLPKFLAACPEGEHHLIGLLLFTLFLRGKGAPVIFLGANTPNNGLSDIIVEQDIRYVCLSLTNPNIVQQVKVDIQSLHVDFPHLRFAVGGQGLEEFKEDLPIDFIKPHLEDWEQWFKEHITETIS